MFSSIFFLCFFLFLFLFVFLLFFFIFCFFFLSRVFLQFFLKFFRFRQVKGNARCGRSRHRPTNQSYQVCKVDLATLGVAIKTKKNGQREDPSTSLNQQRETGSDVDGKMRARSYALCKKRKKERSNVGGRNRGSKKRRKTAHGARGGERKQLKENKRKRLDTLEVVQGLQETPFER